MVLSKEEFTEALKQIPGVRVEGDIVFGLRFKTKEERRKGLNERLWQWLKQEPEGDLTIDLNLCFKVFSAKLQMVKNEIQITFLQYEEGFFEDGATWHCWGAQSEEVFSFMEGYGINPAMAFCDAMERFRTGRVGGFKPNKLPVLA